MNDFKSFAGGMNGDGAAGTKSGNESNPAGGSESARSKAELAAMIAKAFGGKSEAQIWQAILTQAEAGKRAGTLTDADLDNFYASAAPLLDGFKRQKLKKIICRLKEL